ncbi:hypothetical protein B0H11DRAFT_2103436 [Mycena galericulata]|nr:hypothetical protein B0H11DRAFT_2103436 [Mycena galericulata]
MECQGEPRLPSDLEREIFEWTAIAYPRMILHLFRVARRVKLWVEPYLYRLIYVCDLPPYPIMENDILRPTPRSKPASFYRDAVRHLGLSDSRWSPPVLEALTGVRTFAAMGEENFRSSCG